MYLVINSVSVYDCNVFCNTFSSVICLDFYVDHFCKGYPSGI